jgi:hypothetical protein
VRLSGGVVEEEEVVVARSRAAGLGELVPSELSRSLVRNSGSFAWGVGLFGRVCYGGYVQPGQRPSHGHLEPGSHRPPYLVWHSGPIQPGHPRIVFVAHFRAGLQWKRELKSVTLGRAEPSPTATMDSRVRREPS